MDNWIAAIALLVSTVIAAVTYRGSQHVARRNAELAIAHAGAVSAMTWRDQVWALHDRGLDPEEIRWIMYAESGGEGYERENGIIDEVVRNVPRLPADGLEVKLIKDPRRRLPRPEGGVRYGDGALPLPEHLGPR